MPKAEDLLAAASGLHCSRPGRSALKYTVILARGSGSLVGKTAVPKEQFAVKHRDIIEREILSLRARMTLAVRAVPGSQQRCVIGQH